MPKTQLLSRIDMALELSAKRYRRSMKVARARSRIERLTTSEQEVLRCIVRGNTSKDITAALDLSLLTVEYRKKSLLDKLEVHSRPELFALVRQVETPHPDDN